MHESAFRSLRDIEAELARLDDVAVEEIANISYGSNRWPILCVRSIPWDARRPTVLLSGGIHGDEPAGVYAALAFLAEPRREFADQLQFVVFPCVNPSGFEAGSLGTRSGANVNRLFGADTPQPENRAIEEWLRTCGICFRMTFDLHEARPDYVGEGFSEKDNPRGAYLYEFVRNRSDRLGRLMIDALPPDRPICDSPTIYNDINHHGVITYPDDCRNEIFAEGTSFDAYLFQHHTDHAFTLETPTGWPLLIRIDTHLRFLSTALRHAVLLPAPRA